MKQRMMSIVNRVHRMVRPPAAPRVDENALRRELTRAERARSAFEEQVKEFEERMNAMRREGWLRVDEN